MRIYFSSMTLPKKAAKRIQKYYTPDKGYGLPMELHQAQSMTAEMLGYASWHELEEVTKSGAHNPSPLDEDSTEEDQAARLQFQADVLSGWAPVTEPIVKELVLKFRVSAKSPRSAELAEDGYRSNAVFYWEPYGEAPEWRFRPSARSRDTKDDLFYLGNEWERGKLNLGDYREKLDSIIAQQPENITAYLHLITAAGEIDAWDYIELYLPKLEIEILKSLPKDYPLKKKVPPLIWGTIDNRDYLRCLYFLGEANYANGNYKKAKQWFLFLRRCSERNIGHEKFFLHDLRQKEPEGDLHLLDGIDMCDRYLCPETGKWLHRMKNNDIA